MKKFLIVLLLFSSIACSGEIPSSTDEANISPTLSSKPDWLVRWLNEPVCQPPCWEKITPGKTSFADALAIAKTTSGFELGHVDDDSIQLNYNQGSVLLLSREDANIQEMDLDTNYTLLELGEIVDRYGFPAEMIKYGLPSVEFSSVWIDLLYYDLGMVISFYALPDDPWNRVILRADTSIALIKLYVPQLDYYFNEPLEYGVNFSPSIKLNGYGNYDIPEGRLSP